MLHFNVIKFILHAITVLNERRQPKNDKIWNFIYVYAAKMGIKSDRHIAYLLKRGCDSNKNPENKIYDAEREVEMIK